MWTFIPNVIDGLKELSAFVVAIATWLSQMDPGSGRIWLQHCRQAYFPTRFCHLCRSQSTEKKDASVIYTKETKSFIQSWIRLIKLAH